MRSILFLCTLLAFSACDVGTTVGSDFGVVLPGCRGPNSCWNIHCNCVWDDSPGPFGGPFGITACNVCDPSIAPGAVCDCAAFADGGIEAQCLEQAQVCVGRAATTCSGSNARCLRVGHSCTLESGGDPPEQVASVVGADGGPSTEQRCPYSNDVCCN